MMDNPVNNIFKELSLKTNAYINDKSVFRHYNSGQQVIQNEDISLEVYFVLRGEANALNFSDSGKSVHYAQLKAGDFFGELSALDGLPRSATVITSTECDIAILTRAHFNHLVDNDLTFNRLLLNRLVGIIRSGNERISDFILLGANQRVCIEILRLAEKDINNIYVIKNIPTQEEFAKNTGTSRESVIRTFKKLSESGIIMRSQGRKVYIHDKDKLEIMALS